MLYAAQCVFCADTSLEGFNVQGRWVGADEELITYFSLVKVIKFVNNLSLKNTTARCNCC